MADSYIKHGNNIVGERVLGCDQMTFSQKGRGAPGHRLKLCVNKIKIGPFFREAGNGYFIFFV